MLKPINSVGHFQWGKGKESITMTQFIKQLIDKLYINLYMCVIIYIISLYIYKLISNNERKPGLQKISESYPAKLRIEK